MNMNAPGAGNSLICVVTVGASTTTNAVTSITQSGVAWQRIAMAPNSGGVDTEIWFATNVPSSAGTSLTLNTSSAWQSAAVVAEYTGLTPAQVLIPVDWMAANSGVNGRDADTGTTPITTQPYELWFGGIGLNNSTNTVIATNNSFGIIAHSASSGTAPNPAVYALEQIVSTSGHANSGLGLGNGNANWNGLMVAFKPPLIVPTNQIATVLAPVIGVHPRLFLNASNVAVLRGKLNSGKYAFYWNTLTNYAMTWANNNNPPTPPNASSYGNTLGNLAFAYLLSTNAQFKATMLAGGERWATNLSNWIVTNSSPDIGNYDPGIGLLGLSLFYDYTYTNLDATSRQIIYNGITTYAAQEDQYVNSGQQNPTYVSNWLLIPDAGVLYAGLATFDQPNNSAALNWISLMLQNMDYGSQMLSPDGFGYEGVGYTEFAHTHFLLAMQLCQNLLNIDFVHNYGNAAGWSANVGGYYSDMLIPRNSWVWYGSNDHANRAVVPFEDCFTYNLPDASLLRGLAHCYNDPCAQYRADQVDQMPSMETDSLSSSFAGSPYWVFLYWYDDGVASISPANQPTLQVFTNLAVVSSRSDWSGNESLVTFKCGGPGGIYLPANFANYYNVSGKQSGLYHEHPDAGSFCFYGGGDCLVQEMGYELRTTINENTLLLDGAGQYGEPVINRVSPGHGNQTSDANYNPLTTNVSSLVYTSSTPAQDVIVGDAANAYAYSGQGVQTATPVITSFQRHLLFVKPNMLIVGDKIQMSSANHALELLFHLPNTNSLGAVLSTNGDGFKVYNVAGTDYLTTNADGSWSSPGTHTVTRIDLLTTNTATMTHAPKEVFPKEGDQDHYALATLVDVTNANVFNQKSWTNVMAFSWAPTGSTSAKAVLLSQSPSDWVYQIGTHVVDLNWSATPTNPVVFSTNYWQTYYGTTNTIAAFVASGTGTAQFYVDGTNWGAAVPLNNGQAWLPSAQSLGAGSHTVMAIYSGDATHSSGPAASEATLNILPLPVVLTGTWVYNATPNAPAATLMVANNLDGTNLTLTGAGWLASKSVGAEPVSIGAMPVLVDIGTATADSTNAYIVTLPTKPVNGNTLIAVSLYRTGGTHNPGLNSISQTGANWTQAVYTNGCGNYVVEIWYATNVFNAGTNVTLNVIGYNPAGAAIMEYGGLLAVNPLDGSAGNGSATAGTTANTGTIATTTQANELWIAAVGLNSSSFSLSQITGGFNLVTNVLGQSGSTFNLAILHQTVTATGSANTGGTISSPSIWNGVIAAFKSIQSAPPLNLTGPAASNYTLSGLTGFVTITNAWLTVSGITASNKVYDGTALARLNTNSAAFLGDLDGTNVLLNLAGGLGTFLPDGSAGTNKTVQISGLTVSGSATNNYLLIQPTTTANIAAFKVALTFGGNPTTLSATGTPGSSYITQRSTNLVNWVNIATNLAATPSGVITITDSYGDLGGHQPRCSFYRLEH